MRLAPGTILRDKYQIVRSLDEGGGGEVFEARHVDLAGRYAIKLLCEGGIRNAILLDALRREALATSVLTHPGIVRVYDLDQAPDGSPFLAMEYLNGRDLGHFVAKGKPMALTDVATIVEAIAAPLAEAHSRGIVHGDLTPENVFLLDASADAHARVKILDFGVARIRAQAGGIVREGATGPSPYLAPEQQRSGHEWEVDERTDVFALGAIAYALIGGRAPGPLPRAPTAGRPVVGDEAPPLATLATPPVVAAAVARAMSRHRDGRFRSVTDFAQALRAAVSASPARSSGLRPTRPRTPAVPVATVHEPTARVRVGTSWQRTVAAASGCGLAILIGVVVLTRVTHAPHGAAPPPPAPPRPVVQAPPAPVAPPPAAAVVPAPAPPTQAARQPPPVGSGRDGELHRHRHFSPHAGMTEADRREMEQSYQKATRAFDVASYDEAIGAYKRTYELGGDAPMLYNIAQALRLGGRPDEAIVYYRRYLDRAPAAPNRDEVRARIAALGGVSAGASPAKAAEVAAASPRSPFDCHWPDHATVGNAIDVSCSDPDPQTPVAKMFVLYRETGTTPFSLAEMARGARGSYKLSIPKSAVSPKGLELYFEGRRASGEPVAQNGTATRPNAIRVGP